MVQKSRSILRLLPGLLACLLAACVSAPPSMPLNIATDIPDSMAESQPEEQTPTAQTPAASAADVVYKRAVNFAVDKPLSEVFQIEVRRANNTYERYRFPNSAVPRVGTDAYLQFREQWVHLAPGDEVVYEGPALK